MWTTGWVSRPLIVVPFPPGRFQYAPGHVLPPVAVVVEVDGACALPKHERARHEELGIRVGKLSSVERPLGERHVLRLADEPAELCPRDRGLVHPEPVDRYAVDRALLGVEVFGAHRERPTRESSACLEHGGEPGASSGAACSDLTPPLISSRSSSTARRYCLAIATRKSSSESSMWSASAAAPPISISTQLTSPVKAFGTG